MVKTASTMLDLGTQAPPFELPDTEGKLVSLDDFTDKKGLLVMFICNHCPFVKHISQGLADFARDYTSKGLGIVAINSNNVETHPQDRPEKMKEEKERVGYVFPYLFDASQMTAKAYRAACTPDFFLFDQDLKLVYRGQFDDSRPGNEVAVSGRDLRQAADAVLEGRAVSQDQKPSVGCNIKWRGGMEPDYFHG
ncbi:MAG TPA: thioredoxin family protein [Acidobacteriota bacterium]|nr:thioredoxin family protein [Acidobacteriota bacterium]